MNAGEHTVRSDWIDVAKGLAILLVVLGHTSRGLFSAEILPDGVFQELDARIYAFHMPAFFALAGFVFVPSVTRTSLGSFFYRRTTRILWPLFLWTYLFVGAKVLAGPYTNSPVSLEALLRSPIPGYLHLWFLWAMYLILITFALFKPLLQNENARLLGLLMLATMVLLAKSIELPPDVRYWSGQAIRYAPYFLLGVLLEQSRTFRNISSYWAIWYGVAFLAFITVWPMYFETRGSVAGKLIATTMFLATVAALPPLHTSSTLKLLGQLGRASMAIYLIHTICSAAAREAMMLIGMKSWIIHLLVGLAVGVLGPLAVLKMTNKLGISRYLGF